MGNKRNIIKTVLFILILLAIMEYALAQPSGANITYNTTETKTPRAADYLNTSGGSFTTMILFSETQNLRWKAYAGNVTGVLTLDDSGNYSIYQWQLTAMTGEVYATRNNSISWSSIRCATYPEIYSEETSLNHTTSSADSINSTFFSGIHRGFFVGPTPIGQSSCRSTFT